MKDLSDAELEELLDDTRRADARHTTVVAMYPRMKRLVEEARRLRDEQSERERLYANETEH